MASIIELEDQIENLKKEDEKSYKIFKRIYNVCSGTGSMNIPPGLKNKVVKYFSPKDESGNPLETQEEVIHRLENQKILKTFNKWSGEGALFNHLRTNRPGMGEEDLQNQKYQLSNLFNDSQENCDFCQAEDYTPEDIFGRIRGKYCITAANIAKYDVWSSLVIFNIHNPLEFNLEELSDYITTGFKWFDKVFQTDKRYKFPFFVWNCLYKAGASQVHGHAQILMSKNFPYAKMESLKKIQENYKEETQKLITGEKQDHDKVSTRTESDYFHDVYRAHEAVGLGFEVDEVLLLASITPAKEKEVIIIPPQSFSQHLPSKKVIFNTLRCLIDVLGVHSYNLALYSPPLDGNEHSDNTEEVPYLVKIVDRGSIFRPTSDMGGMELFGSTVVSDDPYDIIKTLKEYFRTQKVFKIE